MKYDYGNYGSIIVNDGIGWKQHYATHDDKQILDNMEVMETMIEHI